jgi:hypothetical protein
MPIDFERALERALSEGDEWESWRALRLSGDTLDAPAVPYQQEDGAFIGPTGAASAGATGEGLCHLAVIGLRDAAPARAAATWLEGARTPAGAWLDDPAQVPGDAEGAAAGRVWATAAASCGLLALGRDPGRVALTLLRGEADSEGRFTGGAYPTFAAAGAYWLSVGAKSEMAEWSLRWAREWAEEWWGPWEWATALTFWGAAGLRAEHPSVELFLDSLADAPSADGWPDDLGLTVRTLELLAHFGG